MEEKKVEDQPIQGTPYILMPYQEQEDEISLTDLWRTLVRRKLIVFSIAIVVLIASAGYKKMMAVAPSTPLFRAQVVMLPQPNNILIKAFPDISRNSAISSYIKNLKSNDLQQKFFDKQRVIKEKPDLSNITVKYSSNSRGLIVSVTVIAEGTSSAVLAKSINAFVRMIDRETVHQLVESERSQLMGDITYVRSSALADRMAHIARLEEALGLAKKLGIKKILAANPPFMRGIRALSAEISVLRQRKSDDAYTASLVADRNNLAELDKIDDDLSRATLVQFGQPISLNPVQPKHRRFVVAVIKGLLGGLALGVFTALVFDFIVQRRRKEQEST